MNISLKYIYGDKTDANTDVSVHVECLGTRGRVAYKIHYHTFKI